MRAIRSIPRNVVFGWLLLGCGIVASAQQEVPKADPDTRSKWQQLLKRRDELLLEWNKLGEQQAKLSEQFQKLNRQFQDEVNLPASKLAESVYAENPKDLDAAEFLLTQYVASRQFDAAGKLVDQLIEGNRTGVYVLDAAESLLVQFVTGKRFEAAGKLADQLLKAQRMTPQVLNAAGSAYFALHEFAKARDMFQKAGNARDPGNVPRMLAVEKYITDWRHEQELRIQESRTAEVERLPRVLLKTTQGEIEFELFENEAPNTVANFIRLIEDGDYQGTSLNTFEQAFAVSAGNLATRPDAVSIRGYELPDFKIRCECSAKNSRKAFRGSVVMLHRGKDTGNCRFAILQEPRPELNWNPDTNTGNTVFGRVVQGQEVVDRIAYQQDRLLSAKVLFKRQHPYEPERITPMRLGVPNFTALQHGRLDEALQETSAALKAVVAEKGEKHPDTLSAANRLGVVLLARGDYSVARQHFEKTLKRRQEILGEADSQTAESLNNLGVLLTRMAEFATARSLFEKSLAIREKIGEAAAAETVQAQENLGHFLVEFGERERGRQYLAQSRKALLQSVHDQRFSVADENTSAYLVEVLEIPPLYPMLESSLSYPAPAGGPDPDVVAIERSPESEMAAICLWRLGMTARGNVFSRAEGAAAVRATKIFAQLLGPDHLRTALVNVGRSNVGALKHALKLARRDGGDSSPQVAVLERLLATDQLNLQVQSSYLGFKKIDEAQIQDCRSHINASLTITRERCGEQHPDLAKCFDLLGIAAYLAQHYRDACSHFDRSLQVRRTHWGDTHVLTAATHNALGNARYQQGDYAKAQAEITLALRIRREQLGERNSEVAQNLNDLAIVAKARGDYVAARRGLELAIECHPEPPDSKVTNGPRDVAKRNLMALLLELGDDDARRYFQEALTKNPKNVQACINLGTHSRIKGDLDSARRYFEQALTVFPNSSDVLNNLGAIARDAGQWDVAATYFEQSLGLELKQLGAQSPRAALPLTSIGLLKLRQGKTADATDAFQKALAVYQRAHGERHSRTIEVHRLLGEAALSAGGAQEARKWFEASLNGKLQLARDVLPTLSEAEALAFVASLKERDPLLVALRQIPNSDPMEAYQVVWRSRALATQVLTARRSAALQNSSTDGVSDELRTIRKQIANLVVKTDDRYQPRLADPEIAELNKLSPADRDAALAKLRSDARERILNDLSLRKEALERTLAEKLEPFRKDHQLLEFSLKSLGEVLPKNVAIVDFVKTRNWSMPTIDKDRLAENSPAQVATNTFNYQAFVIRQASNESGLSIAWLDLGPAQPIDAATTAWREQIANRRGGLAAVKSTADKKSTDEVLPARFLRESLWNSLENHLGGISTVVVIPDGQLTQVPWPALPGRQPGTYLLEDFAIAMASHGQQLVEVLQSRPFSGDQFLLAGGVIYDDSPEPDSSRATVSANREPVRGASAANRWQYLPGTREETRLIESLRPKQDHTVLLEGLKASESEVSSQLSVSRYVHLATHGFFANSSVVSSLQRASQITPDSNMPVLDYPPRYEEIIGRNPLVLSGLVFAGANVPGQTDASGLRIGDDGILTAEEVSNLDLHATELVVLSACETGLGTVAGGEGVFGLQRAFRLAGAGSVVASLWSVDDAATAALMTEFYRNLWDKRLGKLEALRQAQLTILRRFEPRSGKLRGLQAITNQPGKVERLPPHYWAAFLLSGDWR